MSLFSLRIYDMVAQASLLLSLVCLLAACFCLRIKSLYLASPKCLAFLFGGGMIVISFRQFFLLMIFSFCQLFFWVYHLETGSHSTGQEWREKGKKRLDNEGPSVTEEVHFLNPTVDCWKIWLYTSLANSFDKAYVVSEVTESQNWWRRYSRRNRCSEIPWFLITSVTTGILDCWKLHNHSRLLDFLGYKPIIITYINCLYILG